MKRFLSILVWVIGFSYIGLAQEPTALFKQAATAYSQEDYKQAIKLYESILDQEIESVSVYYNLANAHYKLENVAESIYYYEKALQLAPNDQDVLHNLEYAEQMRIDVIQEADLTGMEKIKQRTINKFSLSFWAWLSIISALLVVLCGVFYFFNSKSSVKRLSFSFGVPFVLVSLILFWFAHLRYAEISDNEYAVIFAEKTALLAEPNKNSASSIQLHAGTKVKVLDSFNSYVKIELPNDQQGWLSQEDLKNL
ncbi:tetratricopeptide repeat protein [uncultured Mesonia sp.]|uniref:tetratricopeptide repeat protein n=1 Tax=uncultured Mesonia sp. TaxID=399731 RepID=UPI00374F83B3